MPVFKGGPGTADPELITWSGIALAGLLARAYDLKLYQIHGAGAPDSLLVTRYNISARLPKGASGNDLKLMLQELLKDRFKLSMHRETHEGRAYYLQVDAGGFKLKESKIEGSQRGLFEFDQEGNRKVNDDVPLGSPVLGGKGIVTLARGGHVTIVGKAEPISALVSELVRNLQAPVIDQTGVKGNYDFGFEFAASELPEAQQTPQTASADCQLCAVPADQPLSLEQALKQMLGLKLTVGKGPVEWLVIDHVNTTPTEN
jgi:uncharacterized protein (TIGR03435 family)